MLNGMAWSIFDTKTLGDITTENSSINSFILQIFNSLHCPLLLRHCIIPMVKLSKSEF